MAKHGPLLNNTQNALSTRNILPRSGFTGFTMACLNSAKANFKAVKTKAISELDNQSELEPEKAASWLISRDLESFAIFFIEAHLPLTSILSTICLVGTPMMMPFVGLSKISEFQGLLEDREKLMLLIELLEESLKTKARRK